MMGLGFLLQKNILARLKQRTIFLLMCFVTKIGWFFQSTFTSKFWKLNGWMKRSHIMHISKILTDLCFTKQRIKTKNNFAKVVYSVLVVKMYYVLTEHKGVCLSINEA